MSGLTPRLPCLSFSELLYPVLHVRCLRLQVESDLCIRMTSLSQLETVQKEIDDVKAEILETKEALATAQHDSDIKFLRQQLHQLRKKEEQLREERILLQGQASGEHCLPCYLLPPPGWAACTLLFYVMKALDHMDFC